MGRGSRCHRRKGLFALGFRLTTLSDFEAVEDKRFVSSRLHLPESTIRRIELMRQGLWSTPDAQWEGLKPVELTDLLYQVEF